jgi:hypothetical protein
MSIKYTDVFVQKYIKKDKNRPQESGKFCTIKNALGECCKKTWSIKTGWTIMHSHLTKHCDDVADIRNEVEKQIKMVKGQTKLTNTKITPSLPGQLYKDVSTHDVLVDLIAMNCLAVNVVQSESFQEIASRLSVHLTPYLCNKLLGNYVLMEERYYSIFLGTNL